MLGGIEYNILGSNTSDRGYSLQLAIGYTFSKHLLTGIGIGFNRYNHGNFRPIYLDLRGDIFNTRRVGVTYYGGLGYGFLTKVNRSFSTPLLERGLFYTYGIGLKLIGNNKISTIISIGNQSQYFEWYTNIQVTGIGNEYKYEERWYNRIVIKLSFMFN